MLPGFQEVNEPRMNTDFHGCNKEIKHEPQRSPRAQRKKKNDHEVDFFGEIIF